MKLIIAALLSFVISTCTAQSGTDSALVFINYGFGYHYQSFNGLNSRIQNRPEYQKLGNNIGSFNLSYLFERKKLLFLSNFTFGNSLTGDEKKRSSSISLFDVGLSLGYNFSNNQKVRFYPFAGLGYTVYLAKFNKDLSAIPFDSVLQSNTVQQRTEPVTFTNGAFTYQGGFGVDFIKQKGRYMRSIGIRLSYAGGFKNETWRINETQVLQNAPTDKLSRFNASLQFGIGRAVKSKM